MEDISFELLQLGDDDQEAFRTDFLALANEHDEPWRSFVRAFRTLSTSSNPTSRKLTFRSPATRPSIGAVLMGSR